MATDWKQLVRVNVANLRDRLFLINECHAGRPTEPKASPKAVRAGLRKLLRDDPEIIRKKKELKQLEDAMLDMMTSDCTGTSSGLTNRQTAWATGAKTYSGNVHAVCGTNERYLKGGACVNCMRQTSRNAYKENHQRGREG